MIRIPLSVQLAGRSGMDAGAGGSVTSFGASVTGVGFRPTANDGSSGGEFFNGTMNEIIVLNQIVFSLEFFFPYNQNDHLKFLL